MKRPDFSQGLIERQFAVSDEMQTALDKRDWALLDRLFSKACQSEGELYHFLREYLDFSHLEHIIAIRSAPGDEDGIWHDDGSRILGFSLSLTRKYQDVSGGHLEFRKKGEKNGLSISTRPMGTILLFYTGIYGYEHRVTAVTAGERIVIAGWCH